MIRQFCPVINKRFSLKRIALIYETHKLLIKLEYSLFSDNHFKGYETILVEISAQESWYPSKYGELTDELISPESAGSVYGKTPSV